MNLMEHLFAMSDLYSGGCLLPPPLPPRSLTPPAPTPPSQVSCPSPCLHPSLPSLLPIPLPPPCVMVLGIRYRTYWVLKLLTA